MGVPYHISRDVPGRCMRLIDELFDRVANITDPNQPELGPMDATFLFAMSTLILSLPIERLEKHRRREEAGEQGYMDDRPLDPVTAKEVDAVLGPDGTRFDKSPVYISGAWQFASIEYVAGQNLAVEFPDELAGALSNPAASAAANAISARQWINCLRNALAHGGIVYLDEDGQQAKGGVTRMMGFVSAIYPNGNMRKPPERLIALRTTPSHFRRTLQKWVCWVQHIGLSERLAA